MTCSCKTNFFYNCEDHGKCRVKRHTRSDGVKWYEVEWKEYGTEDQWLPYLWGTADWLALTPQEIQWAEKGA